MSQYSDEVLADGPLAYWKLDETSGTVAIDSSGNGHHGTHVGAVPIGGLEGVSYARAFTTRTTVADLTGFPTTGPYTLEAWFNTDTHDSLQGIIGYGQYGTNGRVRAVRLHGVTEVSHYWWGNDRQSVVAWMLNDSVWHHIAASYNGAALRRVYVDGALVDTDNPGPMVGLGASLEQFAIGRTWAGGNEYFTGNIRQAAIYPTALDPARITAHAVASMLEPTVSVVKSALYRPTLSKGARYAPTLTKPARFLDE